MNRQLIHKLVDQLYDRVEKSKDNPEVQHFRNAHKEGLRGVQALIGQAINHLDEKRDEKDSQKVNNIDIDGE